MEHLANKFYARWFVWVLLFEVHHQAESSVLEGSICGPDDDCIPKKGISLAEVWSNQPRDTDHVMTLSATGDAETPAGGSVCMRCSTSLNQQP
jgi:hypothetical protein